MARSARNANKKKRPKPPPQVVDQRPLEKRLPRSKERGDPTIPIRTVLYVEVGNLEPKKVNAYLSEIIGRYAQNEHPHYILPVRGGKIGPDIMFEEEFLKVVRQVCEVNDQGEIVLKDGAKQLDIVRKKI